MHVVDMNNFESVVDSHPFVVLDFWANWCAPCKTLGPLLEEFSKQLPEIYFGKVDVETATDLANAFQVRSVPTLIGFHNGELAFEQSGLPPPHALASLLEDLLKKNPSTPN